MIKLIEKCKDKSLPIESAESKNNAEKTRRKRK